MRRTPVFLALAILLASCHSRQPSASSSARASTEATTATDVELDNDALEAMEPQVRRRLDDAQRALLEEPLSAAAWGRFGKVAHAHELWQQATVAYEKAERLDPKDVRWPYYLGDVLSVVGTDLDAAAGAFRRALALRPDYAPAHMRLGRVLQAAGNSEAAATVLERAIEIEPDLIPARLTLAQIRLSQNRLTEAAAGLEGILSAEPRHGQALATLGQVYMRLGRRDEARQIAERARDTALYNLFPDPLMSEVVSEGVSSVLLWERAKAFLDQGNYEQAALGLEQVVALRPDDADAQQQLAVAYGNLGKLDRARQHLETTTALVPDRAEARYQFATLYLEQGEPALAIGQLERLLELRPQDPDARWLLARAHLLAGNVDRALRLFDQANAMNPDIPAAAHNDWGSALAQSGNSDAALEQFRAALEQEPDNAQAHFYIGLVLEGRGQLEEAAERYCLSLRAQPNPGAQQRLASLGRQCG